jgi:hypothetical protein
MGATTASDGSFVVRQLTAGGYQLQVTDPLSRYPSGYYASSGLVQGADQATTVTVAASQVGGIAIVLPNGYSVSGTVRNADGTPLPGVEVSACPKPAPGATTSSCTMYPTWTARDGTYTLPAIAPGTYTVQFADPWQHNNATTMLPDLTVATANTTGYDLTAPKGWFVRGASISGVVRSAPGDPLANVQVWVTGPDSTNSMVKTASDGSYFFGLSAGSYKLRFDQPVNESEGASGLVGNQADASPITLSGAQAITVDAAIPLPAGGLWTMLPSHVGSTQLVAIVEMSGSELAGYVATIPASSFQSDLLAAMGKSKSDILDIAVARDHPEVLDESVQTIHVDATRYSGASADKIMAAYAAAYAQWETSQKGTCAVTPASVSGKSVLEGSCTGQPVTLYVYAHGDVIFEISTSDSATAASLLSQMP